jgi:hypothetical protein
VKQHGLKHDGYEKIPATLGNQGSTITCAATNGSLTAEALTILSKTTFILLRLKDVVHFHWIRWFR